MKIVLEAFGGKLSGTLEVPEETNHKFSLAMTQPITYFSVSLIEEFPLMRKPIDTICEFEWTGKMYSQPGHDYDGARVYVLTKIATI